MNKRIWKLLAFTIIAFFVLQLVPGSVTHADGLHNHAQNSSVLLPSNIVNSDVWHFGEGNQKLSVQKIPIKSNQYWIPHLTIEDISSAGYTSFQEMPFDYRSVIRQSIPHYFNGGKYKRGQLTV